MKTNENVRGGSLKKEYYAVYAQYLVRYIQAMQAQGINLDAITIQNPGAVGTYIWPSQ